MSKEQNRTIKKRIIYTILALIVVPSMIAFYSILSIYTKRISVAAIDAKMQVLIQINKSINTSLKKYSDLTMQIYYNAELINAIGEDEKSDYQTSLIREYLNSCVNSDKFLSSAYVTMQNDTILTDKNYQGIDQFFDSYKDEIEKKKGKIIWIPTQRFVTAFGTKGNAFVAARSIRKDNEQIGILWLFVDERFFNSFYDENTLSDGSTNVILSADGALINVSGSGPLPDRFQDIITNEQSSKVMNIGGERQLIVYSVSDETKWAYINIMPESGVLKGLREMQLIILAIILLYAVCIILMATVLNRRIVKPIQRLSLAINDFAAGKLEASVTIEGDDEIRLLNENFNDMVREISALMLKVKNEERAKNHAKIRALSMQISPHFIYNTLNSIKWIAEMNKQENIRLMLQAIITFLRGVSKYGSFITLRDEISLIENYLYLQKIRYMNFDVSYEIDPDTQYCVIGKLLLQPIVENAILHGIANKQNGLIKISASIIDNQLVLVVEDNGRGFEPDSLSDSAENSELGHVGIINVCERVRLEYGEAYGVQIKSKAHEGTVVTMLLPVIHQP